MRHKQTYRVTGRPHKSLKGLSEQQRKPFDWYVSAFSKFDAALAFMRKHARHTVVNTERCSELQTRESS